MADYGTFPDSTVLPVTSDSGEHTHILGVDDPLLENEVRITASIHYISNQAPEDEEWDPILVAYLPSTFDRVASTVSLKPTSGDVPIALQVCGLHPKSEKVSQATRINFQVYTTQMNKYGAPCYVDSGCASIPLYDLWRGVKKAKEHGAKRAVISAKLPTLMHVAHDFQKGELRVSIDTDLVQIGNALQWAQHAKPTEDILKQAQINEKLMIQYARSALQECEDIPLTYEATKNIRCPFYPSECSPVDGAMALPAFTYSMYEVPKSDPDFFALSLRNVLRRERKVGSTISTEGAASLYETLSAKQQASVMVRVCCHMPQGFDYVSDTINMRSRRKSQRYNSMAESRRAVENFGDALQTLSGDCEDDANSICQIHTALVHCDIREGVHFRGLVELQKMAKRYVPVMSLDGVTSSHIQNDVKAKKAQRLGGGVVQYKKLGAHMNVNFLPLHYHDQCLWRGGVDVPEEAMRPVDAVASELEVLIGEGTGMFDPEGRADEVENERSYTCYPFSRRDNAYECMRRLKKPICHSRSEESSFYKVAKVGWERMSDGSARGLNYAVCEVKHYDGMPKSIIRSIGVSYQDLWNMSDRVALLPHVTPSQELMDAVRSVVSNRVPARPLYGVDLPRKGPSSCPARRNLQELQEEMMDWGRAALPERCNIKTNTVSAYGPSHCFNDEWLNMAKAHFKRAEWIKAISWECEPCTQDYYLYKLNMHVVPPKIANQIMLMRKDGVQLKVSTELPAYGIEDL